MSPLAEYEANRSRFSRARLPPGERRLRVTQTTPSVDTNGRAFMTFAIDVKWGGDKWNDNDIVGCVYTKTGEIFVKRGEEFRSSAILLGKPADPVAGVCKAAPRA